MPFPGDDMPGGGASFSADAGEYFAAVTGAELLSGAENRCYSPVSLYLALAMAGAGAAGDTQAQIYALLGAEALGDIGKHFPDTDPAYKGISSIKLLEKVGELLEENHVFIENIDATIIAQAPKMRPHIDTMRENIAKALLIDVGQVNVKATTEEGLGFTGSGEGISSQAICLVTTPFDLTAQAVQGGCGSCGGCPKS